MHRKKVYEAIDCHEKVADVFTIISEQSHGIITYRAGIYCLEGYGWIRLARRLESSQ